MPRYVVNVHYEATQGLWIEADSPEHARDIMRDNPASAKPFTQVMPRILRRIKVFDDIDGKPELVLEWTKACPLRSVKGPPVRSFGRR